MKTLLLACAGLLLVAIAPLPIEFYTILRISITIGCIVVIVTELEDGFNFWIILFGILALIFNPIFPFYLHDKNAWIPIDLAGVVLFLVKFFSFKKSKKLP